MSEVFTTVMDSDMYSAAGVVPRGKTSKPAPTNQFGKPLQTKPVRNTSPTAPKPTVSAPSKPQLAPKPAITSPKPVIAPTDVQIKPKRPAAQGSQTVVPVPSTTVVIGDNASVGTTKSMVADEAGSYAGGGGGGMSSAPSEEAAAEQSTDQAAADEAKKKKKGLMFLLIAGGAIALIMFSGKK